jgi:ABC-type sugar transport system ATPase subunit
MPAAEPLLACRGLEKSFSGVRVLKGVSFDAPRGTVLGMVGENGAGKSTLMNLIGGVHRPSAGLMTLEAEPYAPRDPLDAARRGIAFVHQELNLFGNLSIEDNIFIASGSRREMRATTRALLGRVGLDVTPAMLVETLPLGERQLVEIAKALHGEAKLIIFDEPTTSLSSRESARLFEMIGRLRAAGMSILYISHALDDVLRLSDDIVVLRDGEVTASGPGDEFTKESLITAMVGRPIELLFPSRDRSRTREVALEVRGLSQPGVLENVTFAVHKGEIAGIAGLMGSGRSELARIIFGLDPHSRGTVVLDGEDVSRRSTRERIRRGLAFLTESRRDDGLFMDAPVDENLEIVHPEPAAVTAMAESLRVACANLDRQPVRQLSGGNQQKVALGKWLLRPPKVLILDEPTRGVDVGAKHEIYRFVGRLAAGGTAILAISSEIEELMGLCDRILVMARGEIRGEFEREFNREAILGAAV